MKYTYVEYNPCLSRSKQPHDLYFLENENNILFIIIIII